MTGPELRQAIERWIAQALSRLNVDAPETLPRCPRCGGATVLSLGRAHSSLEWVRCLACAHVWAFNAPETTVHRDAGAPGTDRGRPRGSESPI